MNISDELGIDIIITIEEFKKKVKLKEDNDRHTIYSIRKYRIMKGIFKNRLKK